MKYDWKKENPKNRYIDDINEEEAKEIAYLATGKLKEFELIKVEANCNPNNIPHVKIYYKGYEPCIYDYIEGYVGIFDNLNVYLEGFHSTYCQRELHEKLKEFNFD